MTTKHTAGDGQVLEADKLPMLEALTLAQQNGATVSTYTASGPWLPWRELSERERHYIRMGRALGDFRWWIRVGAAVAPPPWTPPSTHIGANTIINGDEFAKGGKRPPRSTLQNWEEADRRAGVLNDADVLHAPDNGEKHYPREWVEQRIRQWSPRTADRKP
ncbi:MAG: hypothetical protein PVJ57_22465 [Phycisphaerae bacterium]|jgi:hypothetical protein